MNEPANEPAEGDLLERAQLASEQGDWLRALDLFIEADSRSPLESDDLPMLAEAAYAAGRLDITIEAWERAHQGHLRAGDRMAAAGAAVRVALHLLIDTALMAPIRGWLKRAERLLEGFGDEPVHAWLAVCHSYERMLSGDAEAARRWARRAVDVGSRLEPAAAAVGRVAEARAVIFLGDVDEGLALLDEAGVAAAWNELDAVTAGIVYCELVCALQGLARYDQAEEWTEAMERWSVAWGVGTMRGRCRVHKAEILRLRGSWPEAEEEALLACEELRPYLRRELGWPLTELGRIRLQKGDLEGAEEAFIEAHELAWDPHPGLALVHLARGDIDGAAALIRDALDHPLKVPSKEQPPDNDLRRAPLLAAQVEIAVAGGDLESARSAADDLEDVARRFQSRALEAMAASARGMVQLAEGDHAEARHRLETATRLWHEVGAPYEAATARLRLSEALRADGNKGRAEVELRTAQVTLERVGARPPFGRSTEEPAHTAPPSAPSADGVFQREGDYWCVSYAGNTVRLRDRKGMGYLARLLSHPDREFHAMDLVNMETGETSTAPGPDAYALGTSRGDAGEMLDARAKEAYRRRLAEIEEDLDEASVARDFERVAQAERERDFLIRELSRAVGLGGTDRRAGSASERARVSVTRALRQAMQRIRDDHPGLADHLDRAIRTGTYCAYLPDPRARVDWQLEGPIR